MTTSRRCLQCHETTPGDALHLSHKPGCPEILRELTSEAERLGLYPTAPCRCGYTGEGHHPCHGRGYTCRQPAKERFYSVRPVALAGQQLKLGAQQTWACDECWLATEGERAGA